MEIQARWFEGWTPAVRTDCKEPRTTICFPSLGECPYEFPSVSPTGWNTVNSTLVYLTTGAIGTRIDEVLPESIIGIWWKNRITKNGNWIGMRTRSITYPFEIPRYSNAIAQIDTITEQVSLKLSGETTSIGAMDGKANPYQWPRRLTPVFITGRVQALVKIRTIQPRILG